MAARKPGAAAQNSPTPAEKIFTFHHFQMLSIDGLYYDPSYGLVYTNDASLQSQAIAGYANVQLPIPPASPSAAVKPVTNAVEIHITQH
jgi:hypothetical protein